MRLCAKYGITELSNYVLYNSEDFGGKGKKYHADTPKDLYDRMRFTLNLKDEINEKLPIEKKVAAFSFPMRYIPLSAHERGYVGSQWNAKFLRAVQCMLIPTQGKGVGSRSFFEADFGKDADEFVKFLSMPDKLIAARGKFSEKVRGKHNETEEDLEQRKVLWEKNQRKLNEWNSLYALMKEDEIDSFVSLIGDNEYFPEKVLGITSDLQKKMYLHYLTIPRLISLLGMINHNSPTYNVIYKYITNDFDDMYGDIIDLLMESESQPLYIFRNFVDFFGKKGIIDLLNRLYAIDFDADRQLKKWHDVCKKNGVAYIDFELIRIYRRYVVVGALSEQEHEVAKNAILQVKMSVLADVLNQKFEVFQQNIFGDLNEEKGQAFLKMTSKSILKNIHLKLSDLLEENHE